ncbi:endosome/lysosome-associated apoptosis and autophagy regulator family member 2-like [Sycon ciliatum]|uniref:endosome/lysosome-associated apoptosis and autophagy regulator family member 2-like n=1 Tax=Sycon ciliatum TaxID=27933 RepID=UPI0031F6D286
MARWHQSCVIVCAVGCLLSVGRVSCGDEESGTSEAPAETTANVVDTPVDEERPCTVSDYDHIQTKCDEHQRRWYVAVPKLGAVCYGGYVPPPRPGSPCNYTCQTGQYMDEMTQTCQDCAAGTFSLGDGVRWEDFHANRLPGGFRVEPRNAWEEINNIKGVLSDEKQNFLSSVKELEHIFTGSLNDNGREGRGVSHSAGTMLRNSGGRVARTFGSEDPGPTEDGDNDDEFEPDCSGQGWSAHFGDLVMTNAECSSSVSVEIDLVKDGEIRIQYSYPTTAPFYLMLEVKSYTCSGTSGPVHFYKALNHTSMPLESFEWQTIELKAGHNVLALIAITNYKDTEAGLPLRIRRVEVTGLAYATACTACPAGTFSDKARSPWCTKCVNMMYSDAEASTKCKSCDPVSQYPSDDHSECVQRKPCTKDDYWKVYDACDGNGKTNVTYEWTQPMLCNKKMTGAAQLPKAQVGVSCPPCNPGMSIQSNHSKGHCSLCPMGSVSDGRQACHACKPGYQTVNGIHLNWWDDRATEQFTFSTSCRRHNGDPCLDDPDKSGWNFESNYASVLQSTMKDGGTARFRVYVLGFAKALLGAKNPRRVGSVEFSYELNCPRSLCDFSFYDKPNFGGQDMVWSWNGDGRLGKFTYHVMSSAYHEFTWVLTVSKGMGDWQNRDHPLLKINSIDVNNTMYGGGTSCQDCSAVGLSPAAAQQQQQQGASSPHEGGSVSCQGCPRGNYLDTSIPGDHTCTPCPAGTALSSGSRRIGANSCVPCGPGARSKPASEMCYSNCTFKSADSVLYDFTQLAGSHAIQSPSRFTPKGTRYVYEYRVSICGAEMDSTCFGNLTSGRGGHGVSLRSDYHQVDSKVCRHTVAYVKDAVLLHGYPIGLGMNLISVEHIKPSMTPAEIDAIARRTMNTSHVSVQRANSTGESLISMFYHSDKGESRCDNGRMSIINLHCDASKEGSGELQLATSENCPAGTCDGCAFHFIWHTAHACRVCLEGDYHSIRGVCAENRSRLVEYKWNGPNGQKHCYGGVELPKGGWVECKFTEVSVAAAFKTYLPFVLAIPGVALFIVLALIVVICKNRRLTHQYQKLVQTASAAGELPAPPTCVDDEDEEEEEVMFARGKSQTKKLVQKLQGLTKSSSQKKHAELEADVMMDSLPLTDTTDM